MPDPRDARRKLLQQAGKYLLDKVPEPPATRLDDDVEDYFEPPRLTFRALTKISMSRSREKIMGDLDEMYREAFEKAKASGDAGQMQALDFAYRREQLYFEILLDVREAMERR